MSAQPNSAQPKGGGLCWLYNRVFSTSTKIRSIEFCDVWLMVLLYYLVDSINCAIPRIGNTTILYPVPRVFSEQVYGN